MKYVWRLIFILAMAVLYVGYSHPDWIVDPPFIKVSALSSDKYDGDCQPSATAGRCADKCPADSYLQGYDKDTGAAVCKPNDQTDPSQTNQAQLTTQSPVIDNTIVNQSFEGK